MHKHRLLWGCALLLIAVIVGGCLWHQSGRKHTNSSTTKDSLTLALDWTPNTNHTGIYVAQQKGWYKAAGINLKLLPYSASVSSDQLVATGKADVGISSTEAVVADAGSGSPLVSIAAIVAHNTSVLAIRQNSGVTSAQQLDGKTYGGFGAPYESAVISQVIKHDGGSGAFQNVTLDIDPIQALQSKKIDFVWVFSGWEVIQAQRAGLKLTTFPITSYGVPDYSTPDLITSAQTIKQKQQLLQKFMTATARGYEYARTNPTASAKILIDSVPKGTFPDPGLVTASQAYLSSHYQDAGKSWGIQTQASWHNYPQFMLDHSAVVDAAGKPVTKLDFDSLYSNEFFQ
jgi:ABC-type nitrate/sulfonate/bicarbonate transport system substrate-binding protein